MKRHNGMRPQDVVILLKMITLQNKNWTFSHIAGELQISESEVSYIRPTLDVDCIVDISIRSYFATKFEALNSRGGMDIRCSHDWEDIVFVMSNCSKLINTIKKCNNHPLIKYLQEQYLKLLKNRNLRETIYTVMPYQSEEENVDEILHIINEITQLTH